MNQKNLIPSLLGVLITAHPAAADDLPGVYHRAEISVEREAAPSSSPAPGPLPTIPSGTVPSSCLGFKLNKQYPQLLDCYLNHADNYLVAHFISTTFTTGSQPVQWKSWPAARKAELSDAFAATLNWRDSGMQTYVGVQAPAMPANIEATRVMQGVHHATILDDNSIWLIYRSRIALLLAAEIYAWTPWSFKSYLQPTDSSAMTILFSDRMGGKSYTDSNGKPVNLGRGPMYSATPGNPLMIYRFLATNGLIGTSRADTIERILNWSRWNLSHMLGEATAGNLYAYWQYWGEPPVQQVLTGTITTSPGWPNETYATARHWTQGCYGTLAFLIELFQVVNIPVAAASAGPHATLYFAGERRYQSHADDSYNDFARSTRPVSAFLIDPNVYAQWFPAGGGSEVNVGRAVMEDNIQYPSPALALIHKADVDAGRTHAASEVYALYKNWYRVSALEQTGLWQRLDYLIRGWSYQ